MVIAGNVVVFHKLVIRWFSVSGWGTGKPVPTDSFVILGSTAIDGVATSNLLTRESGTSRR